MYSALKISLLGAPQVELDGTPVTGFVTRKAEALFYYLAATGRMHTRDALAALFWPDTSDSRAKKNLRDLLFNLRQLLGDYLIITRNTLTFAQDRPYWLDVEQLRTQVKQATSSAGLEALHNVIALYHGEFLEGFFVRDAIAFEEWMLLEREQLHEVHLHVLSRLADYYIAVQDYSAALPFTQKLLALQPWHEQAHRQQMLCLAHTGRLREALAQYHLCRELLANELALVPTPETTNLYELLRSGQLPGVEPVLSPHVAVTIRPSPQLQVLQLPPNNLSRQLTPFFGRTIEITKITTKILQPDCAWLTLAGEGGIGKTRLALNVAREVLPYFRDGVWLVGLTELPVAPDLDEQLAATIGHLLHVPFVRTAALLPQLLRFLRERQMLLIFDNFEQVGQAGATFIHQLLQATQQLKVLVISRHRLNYQAENLFVIDLLPLPQEEDAFTLPTDKLLTYAAIALFVHRAAQIRFDFVLTEENAAAVLQICRIAQGLPLAIELAATLIQHHDCKEIADLLVEEIHRIEMNFLDLPARHRSLQATLAYSWQFLAPAERALLAQCTLFVGGFTTAAVAAVAGITPAQLQQWESQALLQNTTTDRYEMHSFMRQYTFTQLQKLPALAESVQQRHALYFLELLQSSDVEGVDDARAIDALHTELENICRGWEWLLGRGEYALLLKSLPRLVWLFTTSGTHGTAVQLFQRSIRLLGEPTPQSNHLLANLLLEQAYFYTTTAHLDQAKSLIQAALALAHTLDDLLLTMTVYWRLGDIAWAQGEYTEHRIAYEQAIALARANGRPQSEVHCLSNLGMSHDLRGEYSQAIHCYEAALTLTRQLGDAATENVIYNNLGVSNILLEDFTQALHYYSESLELSRRLGDQEGSGFANLNLGLLYNSLGAWAQARWHGERALKIFRMIGDRRLEARALAQLGLALHVIGEASAAASNCQQALYIARMHGYQAVEAEALTVWGQLLVARQQYTQAIMVYQEALNLWQKLGRTQRILLVQGGLVDSLRLNGDLSAAQEFVEAILAVSFPALTLAASPLLVAAPHPDAQPTVIATPTIASQVLFACCKQLLTQGDVRAATLLHQAQQLLQAKAAKIADEQLRHSFIEQIAAHRQLLALSVSVSVPVANQSMHR